jgi:L-aminopeptidase/D-esterase-like protein
MKGGVGTASIQGIKGLIVGALVVVNAFGDVINPRSNKVFVGARKSKRGLQFANSSKWIKQGVTRGQFGAIGPSDSSSFNTTLGIIATNADLTKKEIHQVAQIAHSGLAKTISPFTLLRWRSHFCHLLWKKESGCEHCRASWGGSPHGIGSEGYYEG